MVGGGTWEQRARARACRERCLPPHVSRVPQSGVKDGGDAGSREEPPQPASDEGPSTSGRQPPLKKGCMVIHGPAPLPGAVKMGGRFSFGSCNPAVEKTYAGECLGWHRETATKPGAEVGGAQRACGRWHRQEAQCLTCRACHVMQRGRGFPYQHTTTRPGRRWLRRMPAEAPTCRRPRWRRRSSEVAGVKGGRQSRAAARRGRQGSSAGACNLLPVPRQSQRLLHAQPAHSGGCQQARAFTQQPPSGSTRPARGRSSACS